jgi:hypothetical protein
MEKLRGNNEAEGKYILTQFLKSAASSLDINFEIIGTDEGGHIQLSVEGKDIEVFRNYLDKNIGLAPQDIQSIVKNEVLRAVISGIDENGKGLPLDVGAFTSKFEGFLKLKVLRAQLADGRKLPLNHIIDLFCLQAGVPIEVRVTNIPKKRGKIYVDLSDRQISVFEDWIFSLLDRILIVGVSRRQIKNALAENENLRNIISLDRLSLFSHVVPCKLGIDSASIANQLRKNFNKASVYLFSPQKIMKTIDRYCFNG